MRARLLRALATVVTAVAAVGAAPAAPAAADQYDRADSVVVVPADGGTVTTPFVTSRGVTYLLTVTGTFAHDRYGSLADCGFHDSDYGVVGQQWVSGGIGLLVDGGPADCGGWTSFDHTYTFSVAGTGERLRFAIADPGGHADNAGALEVVVQTGVDVAGQCVHAVTVRPNSSFGELVVTAAAESTGTDVWAGWPVWFLHVRCDVYVGGSYVASVQAEAPGPVVADSVVVPGVLLGPVRKCLTVSLRSLFGYPGYERPYACTG